MDGGRETLGRGCAKLRDDGWRKMGEGAMDAITFIPSHSEGSSHHTVRDEDKRTHLPPSVDLDEGLDDIPARLRSHGDWWGVKL